MGNFGGGLNFFFRSRHVHEEGVLAKEVSAESSVTPKETKRPKIIGPSSALALRAPQPGKVYHSNFLDYTSPFYFSRINVHNNYTTNYTKTFWGFNKRNSQESLHLLVLSLLGRSTPPITPKYSLRINWRNKFLLGYTRKFSGN